jgi:hypothetical protein
MSLFLDLTRSSGDTINVNMDLVTLFERLSNGNTRLWMGPEHSMEVSEAADVVRSRWLTQRSQLP